MTLRRFRDTADVTVRAGEQQSHRGRAQADSPRLTTTAPRGAASSGSRGDRTAAVPEQRLGPRLPSAQKTLLEPAAEPRGEAVGLPVALPFLASSCGRKSRCIEQPPEQFAREAPAALLQHQPSALAYLSTSACSSSSSSEIIARAIRVPDEVVEMADALERRAVVGEIALVSSRSGQRARAGAVLRHPGTG